LKQTYSLFHVYIFSLYSDVDKSDALTTPVVITTASTNQPTTKSAVPASAVLGDEKSNDDDDDESDVSIDYVHLKAADKQPAAHHIGNDDLGVEQVRFTITNTVERHFLSFDNF